MKRIVISMMVMAAVALPVSAQKLVVLHTNDTHSQIEPVRTGRNAGSGGVERRMHFIDSVRAKYGADKVLLLDAGDYNQGHPISISERVTWNGTWSILWDMMWKQSATTSLTTARKSLPAGSPGQNIRQYAATTILRVPLVKES